MARQILDNKFGAFAFWAGIMLLAAAVLSPASLASESPLDVNIELSKTVLKAGQEQVVYLLIDFEGRKIVSTQKRPTLNLALVLDRSGSMKAAGKMQYAKQAAKMVVEMLKPTDNLAVVEYDDRVTVLWPSSPVEAKKMLQRRIDALSPRGSTNLCGGMMKGVEEVEGRFDPEQISRVILLSDGLANRGVTSPREIKRLVSQVKDKGIAISTMGLGVDYNEDLMQDIAQYGGGSYYYIENPKQMGRIFQQEMATLFKTVVKDANLILNPSLAVSKVQIFGYGGNEHKGQTKVFLGTFYSGEKRSLLMKLTVKPQQAGPVSLGNLVLYYLGASDQEPHEELANLGVTASMNEAVILTSISNKVVAEAALIEADERHKAAVKLYKEG
ncbi:MAG: VWA domain-containing protein [Desulfarculaceae bacterium]|nr:VWA domain-containing protein [Desulfarculaceae bacterium]